jgi:hypothetical protein
MASEASPTNTAAQQSTRITSTEQLDKLSSNLQEDVLNNQPEGEDNPLNIFKTYNYLFTLAIIPPSLYNSGNYPPPNRLPNIVIRSQGDWGNCQRVVTEFGAFDYFIDNLIISSIIKADHNVGTVPHAMKMTFTVTEPYSMGLFLETLNIGALAAGYKSLPDSTQVLTIEFAGYEDDDNPIMIPSLTKYLTISINNITMTVTHSGSIYSIEAIAKAERTVQDDVNKTKVDIQTHGITVEDHLTKNLKGSLQFALNRALKEQVTDKTIDSNDTIQINFPPSPNLPNVPNNIGKAVLFKNFNSAGAQPQPDLNKLYNKTTKIYDEKYNVKEDRVVPIPKGSSIVAAITEVILRSDYITNQMNGGEFQTDEQGMINWFAVKPRNKYGSFNPQLNRSNTTWIFDVIPWKVHIHDMLPPGLQPPGYDQLQLNVPKVYNYIYTGKNTEILSWKINYDLVYSNMIPTDLGTNTGTSMSNLIGNADIDQLGKKLAQAVSIGSKEASPQVLLHGLKELLSTGAAGSGTDTNPIITNRMLDHIIRSPAGLQTLDMTIRGDPFWLPNDIWGNTRVQAANYFKNTDGSNNTASGYTYVIANFRTPIDLDPVSGNYKFSATLDTVSGIHNVYEITHRFEKGKFTQELKTQRLRAQLTTSGQGSGFGIGAGLGGGFQAAGATFLLSSLGSLFGGSSVFGSGLSLPGMVGGLLGSAVGGLVDEISSGIGEVIGDLGSSNEEEE